MLELVDHSIIQPVDERKVALINPELASKVKTLGGEPIVVEGPVEFVCLMNQPNLHTYFYIVNAATLDVITRWNSVFPIAQIETVVDSSIAASPQWLDAIRSLPNIDLTEALSIDVAMRAEGKPAVEDPEIVPDPGSESGDL